MSLGLRQMVLFTYGAEQYGPIVNWDGTVRVQRTINGVFKSIERLGSSGHFAVTMDTPRGPRYAQMDASLEWVVTQPIPEASSIAVSKWKRHRVHTA